MASAAPLLTNVSLDDKYRFERSRILLTGIQAMARLPLMQRRRDLASGLNTGGFISGYRGSPLGSIDQSLFSIRDILDEHHVHFQPGLNEELAATAIWGAQQVGLFPGTRYDGVFGMWYGKGPGVDRCGDAFKHANHAGTSRHGGVLVFAGDDHAAKSSTVPHQSEQALIAAMIPVLNPAGVQEILDFGVLGWALSRYSGLWVACKIVADSADSAAVVNGCIDRVQVTLPDDFVLPADGLGIRWPDTPLAQEQRLLNYKLAAALAFARANHLDRETLTAEHRQLGIVTTGKSWLDVYDALELLGLTQDHCRDFGISVYKVGMSWPLDGQGLRAFAAGQREIFVVEEKRPIIEGQAKEHLYNLAERLRPAVSGKVSADGSTLLLPSHGDLSPLPIAVAIGQRLMAQRSDTPSWLVERVAALQALDRRTGEVGLVSRTPYFCSGCPHNTSTRLPEGSRALAGIGCHYMAIWMDRETTTGTQMGGEGVPWVGQAPFTDETHIFANLGDGTYFHSGILAIRQSIAAGVNITYKILFNDAVAMTGGQSHDGSLTVPSIVSQLRAEGVERIVVVTDEPEKYSFQNPLPVPVEHRDDLDRVQREMRTVPGVSVLVYDQTCASEKRRRRKRGRMADPPRRVFINERVCEGCGDCSTASNCLSITPVETEFGRKRQIDQSTCNKDFSCLNGFCPSFVTVEGGRVKRPVVPSLVPTADQIDCPEPEFAPLGTQPWSLLVAGVGGTGVVTIGALISMAAYLEGKAATVLDQTGIAQKGGAVTSHIRLARQPEDLRSVRLITGQADAVIGCDLIVAAGHDALPRMTRGRTRAVVNTDVATTAAFIYDRDLQVPVNQILADVVSHCGEGRVATVDATRLVVRLLGDSIAVNVFMLGFAYQKGLIPLSAAALEEAIAINGTAVELNRRAFRWGRFAAHAGAASLPDATTDETLPTADDHRRLSASLDEMIDRRAGELARWQNQAYANRYRDLVQKVQQAEQEKTPGLQGIARAVAQSAFRLMAYKDEYEVARLFTDGAFLAGVHRRFEGDFKLALHMAPPLLARLDSTTGRPRKIRIGSWIIPILRVIAAMKSLRGTRLDPFGWTRERREERSLVEAYFHLIDELIRGLRPDNHGLAVSLAANPDAIRGYGHVKEASIRKAKEREAELLLRFRLPPSSPERRAAA